MQQPSPSQTTPPVKCDLPARKGGCCPSYKESEASSVQSSDTLRNSKGFGIYDLPMSWDGMSSGHHNQVPKKVVWSSMLSRPSKAIPTQEMWRLRPATDLQDARQP